MTRDEIRQIVWQEMGRMLNVVLTGSSTQADGKATETINNMLPGLPAIPNRPVAFPWGYNASTPDGVSQLAMQAGNHVFNRMVVSHFDQNRPVVKTGECILYNQYGQIVYLKKGAIQLGSMAASQPFLLGSSTNTFFDELLTAIINHTHAAPGTPPTNVSVFEALQTDTVESDNLLSKEIFGE
jgi:hypothetical protein